MLLRTQFDSRITTFNECGVLGIQSDSKKGPFTICSCEKLNISAGVIGFVIFLLNCVNALVFH